MCSVFEIHQWRLSVTKFILFQNLFFFSGWFFLVFCARKCRYTLYEQKQQCVKALISLLTCKLLPLKDSCFMLHSDTWLFYERSQQSKLPFTQVPPLYLEWQLMGCNLNKGSHLEWLIWNIHNKYKCNQLNNSLRPNELCNKECKREYLCYLFLQDIVPSHTAAVASDTSSGLHSPQISTQ